MAKEWAVGSNSPGFYLFLATGGRCTAVSSTPCPANVSHSPVLRSRTPPDLKWLLNERAAIAGEISKAISRHAALSTKLAAFQRHLDRVTRELGQSVRWQAAHQSTLNALDATIGLAYSQVEPDAGGVVRAWAGKYGERGALTQFVSQALREAAPASMTTRLVINEVIRNFELSIVVPADRKSLKNSVKTALYRLSERGLTEAQGSFAIGVPSLWRWKQPDTLADLAVRAAAIAKAAADEAARVNAGSLAPADTHPS